ncbi:hypothetical protein D3C71_1710370 [compost metagenome]
MAVWLAAMGAEFVDTDLVTVTGLAAEGELRLGEGSIDLVVSHARFCHMIGRLCGDADELGGSAEHLDLARRAHLLHPVENGIVGNEFHLRHQLI